MEFNITNLKKHLGPGLGLRKNRYLIEIPVPTVSGETINILCQSAGLPERNIKTTEMWHKGRRYQIRGEMDFIGEYEVSIIDDSDMHIRKMFDTWMKQIDNTRPDRNNSLLGASFEYDTGKSGGSLLERATNAVGLSGVVQSARSVVNEVESAVKIGNHIKNTLKNPRQLIDFTIGLLDNNKALSSAGYMTDINIWQMNRHDSASDHDSAKVYGYKLQNAFPKSIGIVTLEDESENQLSEFSVTFGFSEFIPLYGKNEDMKRAVIGDKTTDIVDGIKKLYKF